MGMARTTGRCGVVGVVPCRVMWCTVIRYGDTVRYCAKNGGRRGKKNDLGVADRLHRLTDEQTTDTTPGSVAPFGLSDAPILRIPPLQLPQKPYAADHNVLTTNTAFSRSMLLSETDKNKNEQLNNSSSSRNNKSSRSNNNNNNTRRRLCGRWH